MKKIRNEFTLIEAILMVVISIIIIIVILSIPALSMARESARKISCTGNLKQIGLSMRMYSNVYNEEYPHRNGRAGLQMLATEGFLENTCVYTCPSTKDIVFSKMNIQYNSSYAYAGGINEASSVDSAIVMNRSHNHKQYGNILFVDGHVKGYAGSNWSASRGDSHFSDFWRKPNPRKRRRFIF